MRSGGLVLVDLWYPCLSSRVDLVWLTMKPQVTVGSWRQEEEDEAEVEDEGI